MEQYIFGKTLYSLRWQPVYVTDSPFALSLHQHLARSAIRVAHDDRAALFSVD